MRNNVVHQLDRIADACERGLDVLGVLTELRHDQRWLVYRVTELTEEIRRLSAIITPASKPRPLGFRMFNRRPESGPAQPERRTQMITITNREKIDGGWSFVDLDGQPIIDPSLLTGWAATFDTSNPSVIEITPWETDGANPFNRTFISRTVGTSSITGTLTGPAGESFALNDSIQVINSAPDRPVFTFSTPRSEG